MPNQGSGWTFTLDELRRYYERVSARIGRADGETMAADTTGPPSLDGPEPPPFFAALEGWYLGTAATLGRRTAELHLALAAETDPAFAPESLDHVSLRALSDQAVADAEAAFQLLDARRETLTESSRESASAVLHARSALLEQLRDIGTLRYAGQRIRVHGDYHLGQVLWTEEDFVILDFEGEPARSLNERRGKYSPLKDVAGMLRSFHYAAYAGLFAFGQSSAAVSERLVPWARAWQHWVSRAFLSAYRETLGRSAILPPSDSFDALLQALILEKALYELRYELNNRPEWARIPLDALATLALPLQR